MPSNGTRRSQICRPCELPEHIKVEIDVRMAAGQRNGDIVRWMRQHGHSPIPTAQMLNRHRNNNHFMGDRVIRESSDTSLAGAHSNQLNLMQRVQLNITHTLLPRLAMIPKKLNTLEEMQEIYAFTKNQLATEFEIAQNTPEVYEHPVTGEQVLIRPMSPNMLKLVKELRYQLRDIDVMSKDIYKQDDIMPELATRLMSVIQEQGISLEEIEAHMAQTVQFTEAEVIDNQEETTEGNGA